MKLIKPGIYDDGAGNIRISITECLAALNTQDTPENRAEMEEIIRQTMARECPGVPVTYTSQELKK